MKHTIIMPKAHSFKQKIIMEAMMTPGLSEVWIACGTKFGKSYSGSACITSKVVLSKSKLYRWVAPIYSQTRIGLKYCSRILPHEIMEINKGASPSIYIPQTDSRIEFKSGKFPEDLEGEGVHGYCLDECAKMTSAVYDSAKTTTTVTRGTIVSFSTPKGKNWFYNKCMAARDEMNWAIKNNTQPTKIFITAPSTDNPAVTSEAVEDARRQLPDRLFRQYYHAEFIEDGSVFVGHRDLVDHSTKVLEPGGIIEQWFHSNSINEKVVIGVDWAKHQDYTVFVAMTFDSQKRRVVGITRFQGVKYTEAVRELYLFSKKFKQVEIIWHDKTGVGEAIDDLLSNVPVATHGISFTNSSKADLINSLMLSIEKKDLILPDWDVLIHELDAFEVSVSDSGTMKYGHPQGYHDDTVIALALVNKAAIENSESSFEIRWLEDLPESKGLQGYYNDIIEDEDDTASLFGLK